jgi:O-antigen/teichoic acid export membrane protein
LRAPALILLERDLEYGAIVMAEFAIAVALNVWSVVTVLAGWGVWGLATATIVSEAAGTAVMLTARSGGGVIRPRLNMLAVREMIVFGARFQAVTVVLLVRTQAINLGVAAIGGLPALGIWSLANRVMRVPFWVFRGLLRVSYPATARLADAGVDLRPVLAKMGRVTAIGAGALLVPLAGTSYVLLPALFGERWASAAIVIPYACAGLIISGPISVAASGYLYTLNDAATPLRATIANSVVWIGLTLILLPYVGSAALGIGWMAGSLVESIVFTVYVRRQVKLNLMRAILPIIGMAVIWSCVGFGLTLTFPQGAGGAFIASVVAGAGFLGGCSLICRADFISVGKTVRGAL